LATAQDTQPDGLQGLLSQIADIDRQIGTASQQIDALKDRRSHLEKLAVEEMQTQRLDGVRVAGRSWRVEYDHFCSVSDARKQAVMEAAKAAGLEESLTTVNTARLKAVLKEMAKAAGRDASSLFSEGTVFEGLVGEHVAPRLRHVTVG
jgi:hypothetical protein